LLDSTLEYSNGSQILLLDLTAKPSDPEMESLGSLELTGAFVDEIGEVNKKAFDILASRVNRWLNKEYGITGKIVGSTNPSPGFVRQEFFDKYEKMGGWPDAEVEEWFRIR
jgi:phage terminase large subunit